MDDEPESHPDEDGAEIDYRPEWPQRPNSGQGARSGLDPSGSPRARVSQDTDISPWTSHPTSSNLGAEGTGGSDPKDTRQLPVVDRSRFDIGRQAQQPVARVERPLASTCPPPPTSRIETRTEPDPSAPAVKLGRLPRT